MRKGCLIVLLSLALHGCSEFKALYTSILTTEDADEELSGNCNCSDQLKPPVNVPLPTDKALEKMAIPTYEPVKKQSRKSTNKASANNYLTTEQPRHSLLKFPAHYYTLQLAAYSSQERLSKVYQRYHLPDLMKVKTRTNGREWHILVHGVYATKEQALKATSRVPYQLSPKPWVRKIGPLQHAIESSY